MNRIYIDLYLQRHQIIVIDYSVRRVDCYYSSIVEKALRQIPMCDIVIINNESRTPSAKSTDIRSRFMAYIIVNVSFDSLYILRLEN